MFLKLIFIRNRHHHIPETNEFKTQTKIFFGDFLHTGSVPWVFPRWSRGLLSQQHFIYRCMRMNIAVTWCMYWQLPHNELQCLHRRESDAESRSIILFFGLWGFIWGFVKKSIDINCYHKIRPGTVGVVTRHWDGQTGFGSRTKWVELSGVHHGCRRLSLRVKVRHVKLTIHVRVVPN